MELGPASAPARRAGAATVEVHGELIICHPDARGVVRLDPVSARLWDTLGPDVPLEELAHDVAGALGLGLDVARADILAFARTLDDAGLLESAGTGPEPPGPGVATFGSIAPGSCAAQRFGFGDDEVGLGDDVAVVLDLDPGAVRIASTSAPVIAHVRTRFADHVVAAADPRAFDPGIELVVASIAGPDGGGSLPSRRTHRLLDHAAEVWFATFELGEAVGALDQYILDRVAMAQGGIWLRLPLLVPLATTDGGRPRNRFTPGSVLLHPSLGRGLDRLLPHLRRAGVGSFPSPYTPIDPATKQIARRTAPGRPVDPPRALALVGPATELSVPEVVQWFVPSASVRDRPHLEAIAALATDPGYVGIATTASLRATAAALVACFGDR